jgi:hypothetical protein
MVVHLQFMVLAALWGSLDRIYIEIETLKYF